MLSTESSGEAKETVSWREGAAPKPNSQLPVQATPTRYILHYYCQRIFLVSNAILPKIAGRPCLKGLLMD